MLVVHQIYRIAQSTNCRQVVRSPGHVIDPKISELFVFMLYVALKMRIPRKVVHFVFCPLKSVRFNPLCVFDLLQPILRSHYRKISTRHDAWMRIRARDTMCCTCFCCVCFCCSVYLSVCLLGNFTLPLKYKLKMGGKTQKSTVEFPSSHFERDRPTVQQSNVRGNIRYTQSRDDLFQDSKWE